MPFTDAVLPIIGRIVYELVVGMILVALLFQTYGSIRTLFSGDGRAAVWVVLLSATTYGVYAGGLWLWWHWICPLT